MYELYLLPVITNYVHNSLSRVPSMNCKAFRLLSDLWSQCVELGYTDSNCLLVQGDCIKHNWTGLNDIDVVLIGVPEDMVKVLQENCKKVHVSRIDKSDCAKFGLSKFDVESSAVPIANLLRDFPDVFSIQGVWRILDNCSYDFNYWKKYVHSNLVGHDTEFKLIVSITEFLTLLKQCEKTVPIDYTKCLGSTEHLIWSIKYLIKSLKTNLPDLGNIEVRSKNIVEFAVLCSEVLSSEIILSYAQSKCNIG